jgi:2-haloacid dehalogenase
MMIDFASVSALTFDCYGTLIDWEAGIVAAFRPILAAAGETRDDAEVLEAFAAAEAALEAGPYRPYREILTLVAQEMGRRLGIPVRPQQAGGFATSVPDWPPFPDSATALQRLGQRFRLGVITNCDDDLFAASARQLGVAFDPVVTAARVRAYKPSPVPFTAALEAMALPVDRVVHVAQSLYHDHVPARRLGLRTVWVDRRAGRPGFGATPPASAEPDLVVPDLASFADLVLAADGGRPAAPGQDDDRGGRDDPGSARDEVDR